MSRVEELITVPVSVDRARRALVTPALFRRWVAPHVSVVPRSSSPSLAPGDRFRMEVPGGLGFDYLVEVVGEREVIFSFHGPWIGRERWSFVADGTDTIVRRRYEVEEDSPLAALAWRTVGRALVIGHLKLELVRFREVVAEDPGPLAEIEAPAADAPQPPADSAFPVDDG